MAVLPPTANVAKVEFDYTWNGEHVENVFHAAVVPLTTAPDLPALGLVFKNWWTANMQARQSSDITLNFLRLTDLTSPASPQIIYTTGLPAPGGNAADSVSNNVSPLIIWDTGVRKRGNQGRTFIPGWREDLTNGQEIPATEVTNLKAAAAALRTALFAMSPDSYFLGLVSYYENKVMREFGEFHPFIGESVVAQMGGIRTRLKGRRRRKKRTT